MATTVLGDGRTIKTKIVNGQTIQTVGGVDSVVPRSEIASTTGDDGRTWTGGYKSSGGKSSAPPKYSAPSYSQKSYPTLSLAEALSQALAQYQPLADLSKKRNTESYAEQKKKLPQLLNARGQAFGGARILGEEKLFDDYTDKNNEIDMQTNSNAMAMAQSLTQASENRADTLSGQDFSRWLGEQNLGMSKYQTELGQFNSDRNYDLDVSKVGTANNQFQQNFGLQQEQLALQKAVQEWAKDPNNWENELKRRGAEAEIAATNRIKTSSGGGSTSSSSSLTPTQAAIASVYEYNSPEEAITALNSYGAALAAQGVDLSKVRKEMQARWPNFDFNTNLEEKRALEKQGYVYRNGKWVEKSL